ncbi:MAG TPA: CPBP family intramembrane glutamic endopeptidase [Gemmatimonadota bacterium]|nr:CPBP family intramembrane glutamic endopeptidase [Gemmatimonadota bacterium]
MEIAAAPLTRTHRNFLTRQRLPVDTMRILDPSREIRVALAFALAYIAASAIVGWVERAWPQPLWGATSLTTDATYALVYKIGLLLVVPALWIRAAGYGLDDLLLGWRPTPRSVATLFACFAAGFFVNASKLEPVRDAVAELPRAEAVVVVGVGGILKLFAAGIPEELVYRWGLQTRLERLWGRVAAIVVTAILFTAWHIPSRYFNAEGAEGTAGDLGSVLLGTGVPVLIVGLIFGWAWDRWRNLPALVAIHWGVDTLPSIAAFLHLPFGGR